MYMNSREMEVRCRVRQDLDTQSVLSEVSKRKKREIKMT